MACSLIVFRSLGFFVLTTPQFNFVLEIDSVLALDPLANFFRQGERVLGARVVSLSNDEVCVLRRNHGAAAPRSLHAKVVDHLPGAERARGWIFEETTRRTRAMRLRGQALTFGFFHARANVFGVARMQNQSRAQE